MRARAKRFEHAVELAADGTLTADGERLSPGERWTAEHLVLAGLVRCSLTSLRYHARHLDRSVAGAASAASVVTRRDEDGRYAFVDVEVRLDVRLDPELDGDALAELLARAERDCFVAASLTVQPRYRWQVAGRAIAGTEEAAAR